MENKDSTDAKARFTTEAKVIKSTAKGLKEAADLLLGIAKLREDPSAWPELAAKGKRLEVITGKLEFAPVQQGLEAAIAEIKAGRDDAFEQYRRRFGRDLAEALVPLGYELGGQYPELRAGIFSIVVDPARDRATIQAGPDILARERPSPARIVAALTTIKKDVLDRPIDEDEFLARVVLAWKRARSLSAPREAGRGSGDTRQGILEVLAELNWVSQGSAFCLDPSSSGFKAVTRLGFAWDLYRLRRAHRLSVKGHRLVLHAAVYDETRKRDSYLWVPDDEKGNGTRFSALSFREEI